MACARRVTRVRSMRAARERHNGKFCSAIVVSRFCHAPGTKTANVPNASHRLTHAAGRCAVSMSNERGGAFCIVRNLRGVHMFHLNPALERLEQRIAPGGMRIPGCGMESHGSKGSKESKGRKESKGSRESKGSNGSKESKGSNGSKHTMESKHGSKSNGSKSHGKDSKHTGNPSRSNDGSKSRSNSHSKGSKSGSHRSKD